MVDMDLTGLKYHGTKRNLERNVKRSAILPSTMDRDEFTNALVQIPGLKSSLSEIRIQSDGLFFQVYDYFLNYPVAAPGYLQFFPDHLDRLLISCQYLEGSFKAAEARYTAVEQVNAGDLERWLGKVMLTIK